MPLYNLACKQPLSEAQRDKVAKAITRCHCEQTAAPAKFVNVMFLDNYPLPKGQDIAVLGGVRTGGNRTPESIERLRLAMRTAIAEAIDKGDSSVGIRLVGLPSAWIMEGGKVLPEPGAEDGWFDD